MHFVLRPGLLPTAPVVIPSPRLVRPRPLVFLITPQLLRLKTNPIVSVYNLRFVMNLTGVTLIRPKNHMMVLSAVASIVLTAVIPGMGGVSGLVLIIVQSLRSRLCGKILIPLPPGISDDKVVE